MTTQEINSHITRKAVSRIKIFLAKKSIKTKKLIPWQEKDKNNQGIIRRDADQIILSRVRMP